MEKSNISMGNKQQQHKGGSSTSRTTERMEKDGNFRKQSKIHDLLNSVKDDVVVQIPSESNETLDDEVQIDPSLLSIPHLSNVAFEQKNFMRVSPQKTSGHNNSRWRKAVQLSKVMMIRPLQSISLAKELKGNESDDDIEEESSIKMIGLLRTIDHSSEIASGILTGLFLWSTMSTISWNYGTTTKNNNENFIRLYYSTIVVLTYLTLTGFIIRLQRVPFSGSMVVIYIFVALLALLIFSCKGYELFRLECNIYHHHLSPEMKKKVLNPSTCPRSTSSSSLENSTDIEIIFVFITNVIQTIAIFCLTCYFHFSSSWIYGN